MFVYTYCNYVNATTQHIPCALLMLFGNKPSYSYLPNVMVT